MEVPSLPTSLARGIAWRRVLAATALCASLAAAGVIVAAQPVRSPWWTYADADASYSGSGLDLIGGVTIRYLDHPGLPLEELAAVAFGAQHAVQRATGNSRSTIQFVDASLLDLE